MGVITTGQTFSSGDQVTATKLNDIANNCTFKSATDTTDDSTLTLIPSSKKLKVKDAGITSTQLAADSVITAKIQDGAVTAVKLDAGAVSVLMPTGSIISFAGSSAPTGYLLCDGAAINRQANGSDTPLFTLLGITYGAGDGSSTYNIPDLRGRVIAGKDNMGGSSANTLTNAQADQLGGILGTETHTLTIAEMPSHEHTVEFQAGNAGPGYPGFDGSGDARNSGNSGSKGLDQAHNNVQPTIVLNYIIKT